MLLLIMNVYWSPVCYVTVETLFDVFCECAELNPDAIEGQLRLPFTGVEFFNEFAFLMFYCLVMPQS